MTRTADELRAILKAYHQVMAASWPDLHKDMGRRASSWATATAEALERELNGYVQESSRPGSEVRLFWKMLPGFTFAGCNAQFVRDTGLTAEELIGSNDLDRRLPWVRQAAKYRADDEAVVASGAAQLNIIERQQGTTGDITWVRVGKAPIRAPTGIIGLLGMYELLDAQQGRRLFAEQNKRNLMRPS
jgi:PAS domain-containing protein